VKLRIIVDGAERVRASWNSTQDNLRDSIQPHMRSTPDSSYNNNGSAYSNVNPYTGQQGTHQPLLYDSNPGYGSGQGSNSRIRPAERPSAVGR